MPRACAYSAACKLHGTVLIAGRGYVCRTHARLLVVEEFAQVVRRIPPGNSHPAPPDHPWKRGYKPRP